MEHGRDRRGGRFVSTYIAAAGVRPAVGTAHFVAVMGPGLVVCLWRGEAPYVLLAGLSALLVQTWREYQRASYDALVAQITLEQKAAESARQDALTKLGNRMPFEEGLISLQAGQELFALLLLDLDRFKPVNDVRPRMRRCRAHRCFPANTRAVEHRRSGVQDRWRQVRRSRQTRSSTVLGVRTRRALPRADPSRRAATSRQCQHRVRVRSRRACHERCRRCALRGQGSGKGLLAHVRDSPIGRLMHWRSVRYAPDRGWPSLRSGYLPLHDAHRRPPAQQPGRFLFMKGVCPRPRIHLRS